MKVLPVSLCFIASGVFCEAQTRSLVTNLQYRLTRGDLGAVTPGPFSNSRTLLIQEGGDVLLRACLDRPLEWTRDRMLFRLAHRHASSTISCREYTSPSMHVVFYPLADGSRQARIHFDLHGPRHPIAHAGEVIRNRLTFGRTSEYAVYRGLVESRDDPATVVPPPAFDFHAHAREYYRVAFGPAAFAGAVFTGATRAVMNNGHAWGAGSARYGNHIEANLVRNVFKQSIQFGFAAAFEQDQSFAVSNQDALGRRLMSAVYHSFFVPGRGGNELAFPRIAAALGAAWIPQAWHPWRAKAPNPWVGTTFQLSSYVLASFWREFSPDIKFQLRKRKDALLRRP